MPGNPRSCVPSCSSAPASTVRVLSKREEHLAVFHIDQDGGWRTGRDVAVPSGTDAQLTEPERPWCIVPALLAEPEVEQLIRGLVESEGCLAVELADGRSLATFVGVAYADGICVALDFGFADGVLFTIEAAVCAVREIYGGGTTEAIRSLLVRSKHHRRSRRPVRAGT